MPLPFIRYDPLERSCLSAAQSAHSQYQNGLIHRSLRKHYALSQLPLDLIPTYIQHEEAITFIARELRRLDSIDTSIETPVPSDRTWGEYAL